MPGPPEDLVDDIVEGCRSVHEDRSLHLCPCTDAVVVPKCSSLMFGSLAVRLLSRVQALQRCAVIDVDTDDSIEAIPRIRGVPSRAADVQRLPVVFVRQRAQLVDDEDATVGVLSSPRSSAPTTSPVPRCRYAVKVAPLPSASTASIPRSIKRLAIVLSPAPGKPITQ